MKFLNSPQTVGITGYPNGTLTLSTSPVRLVEVAPLVFARPDGNVTFDGSSYLIFTTGSNGTYFHFEETPQYYERLSWLNYWDPLKFMW